MSLVRITNILLVLLVVLVATSCTGNIAPTIPSEAADGYFARAADGSDVITNGGFVSDTSGWTFGKEGKKANPSGSWDPSGYANGGAAKISSDIGARKRGAGYWEQVITTEIEAGSSVNLSYYYKTSYSVKIPSIQNISVYLVKPDGDIVNIDEHNGLSSPNDTWVSVAAIDVSSHFDQSGTYKIRLRYRYRTGANSQAQAFAWFDEVSLLVSQSVRPWVDKAPTPYAGGYGESVASTGSHIYVIRTLRSNSRVYFWQYDPGSDAWVSLSVDGLPNGTFRNGTTLTWDNADYLFALAGARYNDSDRRLFFRYSISGDYWTQVADAPAAEGAGDAADWSEYDDKLYAILGSSAHGTVFASYDGSADSWDVLEPPPAGCDDGASVAWTGGTTMYVLRGEYYESVPLQDFWSYDIVSANWTTHAPIPEEDGVGDGGSLIWVGDWNISQTDYVYALGGGAVNEAHGYNFYRYSISLDSWETLPPIPYPVGYYNGNRLGFTSDSIHYWQGSPTTWPGGGNAFAQYAF